MADSSSTDLNRKLADAAEVGRECEALETAIQALRVSYEQYFLGTERQAPAAAHRALKQRLQRLRNSFVRQTALKFRVESLQSKFLTYERLWARTVSEMENGTYRRDLFKARLHAQKRQAPPPAPAAPMAPSAAASIPSEVPPAPPPPPVPGIAPRVPAIPAVPRVARAPGPAGLSDAKLKAIYDAYVTAKKRCNEDVSRLSYESLASTLKKQVPELLKQHKAKSIEFKVVIKEGRAVLRAVPKE